MEKITCVVVDDNFRDLAHLVALIETNSALLLKGSFSSPVEAATFILAHQPQLLFLDIEMPGFTGLDFLKSLPYSPECIFVTAFEEHSVESWEVFAFDFIVKPLRPDRFNKCVMHLQDYFNTKGKANLYDEIYKQDGIVIENGHIAPKKIPFDHVLYFEARKDYTVIFCFNEQTRQFDKKIWILENLGEFMQRFDTSKFERIHRSYAVNKTKMVKRIYREVTLADGTKLPIGQTYR